MALGRRLVRGVVVGAVGVLSVGLGACNTTDLVTPAAPSRVAGHSIPEVNSLSPTMAIAGPTHELRFFVDSDGLVRGVETARVRSVRVGFRPKLRAVVGRQMEQAPAEFAGLADSMRARGGPSVSLKFYEVPKSWKPIRSRLVSSSTASGPRIPAMASAVSGSYPPGWNPETDSYSAEDHEAIVDQGLQDMTDAYNEEASLYGMYEATMSNPERGSPFLTSAHIDYEACVALRAGLIVATVVSAGAFYWAYTSVVAATAITEATIGGVTLPFYPPASRVISSIAAGMATTFGIGYELGSKWRQYTSCRPAP